MWIEASHYPSSLYRSNQSAPTSCCGGTLRGAHGKQRTYDLYHIRVDSPCWPPTWLCHFHTATCTSRYVHCTHPLSNTHSPQPQITAKAGWLMNQHGDRGWDGDASATSNTRRWPPEKMYTWQACLVRVMPKEITVIFLSDDNESVFFLWKSDPTPNWWSRRVHQPSVPKAFHAVKI